MVLWMMDGCGLKTIPRQCCMLVMGGGVYFLPYNAMTFTLYYAGSKETNLVVLKAGFFF